MHPLRPAGERGLRNTVCWEIELVDNDSALLLILDETDSGLDIDALKTVAHGVNALKHPERAVILVTHYQRLLNYIVPDRVHVLAGGRIVRSGDASLALELEARGYGWLTPESGPQTEARP